MFEVYTAAKTRTLPKWVIPVMTFAIAAHVILLGGMLVYNLWKVDAIEYPESASHAVQAAPPQLPKGSAKRGAKPKVKFKRVNRQIVEDVRQVKKNAPNVTKADSSDPDAVFDPNFSGEDGEGGDGEGCPIPPCDDGPAAPPPPTVKKAPVNKPPSVLKALRKSGNPKIQPDEREKLAMQRDGKSQTRTMVKICINTKGDVSNVDVVASSGYPRYDAKIKARARTWRYSPFRVGGQAVPICSMLQILYIQSSR